MTDNKRICDYCLKGFLREVNNNPNNAVKDRLYRIPEIGEKLNMTQRQVYFLIKRGDLKACRMGRSFRVTESDLQKFISNCFESGRT